MSTVSRTSREHSVAGAGGRRRGTLTAALLVLLAAAALGLWVWRAERDPDSSAIKAERAWRLAAVKAGATLPGTPDLAALPARLSAHGVTAGAPVFIRIFKREFELELWMQRDDRFHRFAVYPICRWSGELGPKLVEGDGQSPEGFYTIGRHSLNRNSRWHRAFNLGFPNSFDRAHKRTGSFLMVHGGCSSVGCYAMTDAAVDELWRLVGAALKAGQRLVHVHVFPFRPTEANLAARARSPWAGFWRDLRAGYEAFEATHVPPRVAVCGRRYHVVRQEPGGRSSRQAAGLPVAENCEGISGAQSAPSRDL